MPLKPLLPAFLILMITQLLFAQNNSGALQGYVVLKGDTVKGLFRVNKPSDLYFACEFEARGSSEFVSYTPERLESFFIKEYGRFASKKMRDQPGQGAPSDHFFIILEEGKAILYLHIDKNEKYRLFVEKGKDFYELENSPKSYQGPDGAEYIKMDYRYRGILKVIFQDCNQNVDLVQFNPSDIAKAVYKYNRCIDPSHEKKSSSGISTQFKFRNRIGLQVNSYSTRMNLNQSPYALAQNGVINTQSFGAGLYYQLEMSKIFRFQTGLDFFHSQGNLNNPVKTQADANNPNSVGMLTFSTNINQILLPLDFIFTAHASKKLLFNFSGGYNVILPLNETGTFNFSPSNYDRFYSLFYPAVTNVSPSQWHHRTGFSFGLGVVGKLPKDREILLRLKYLLNNMQFLNQNEINYNILEFSLGFSGLLHKHGNLKQNRFSKPS
jgi:hypothetical protein